MMPVDDERSEGSASTEVATLGGWGLLVPRKQSSKSCGACERWDPATRVVPCRILLTSKSVRLCRDHRSCGGRTGYFRPYDRLVPGGIGGLLLHPRPTTLNRQGRTFGIGGG